MGEKIVGLPKERHVATLSHIKYCQKMSSDNASGATSSYPALDATSPTDSVIQGDFGTLSAQEQERQRDEWKAELAKTEEEIITLKQVLASKEAHAHGLKRRLGITAWREFSEDMTQGLKNLQDSQAYKKTVEALEAAKTRTASVWSSISNSQSFISASQKMTSMGSAFGSAKSKVVSSFSSQNLAAEAGNNGNANGTEAKEDKIPEEK